VLIFSSCPKGITRLFLGRRTSNSRASSVFRSDWRPDTDHPFTRPLGPGDIARSSPGPGEAGRRATTVGPGSLFSVECPGEGAAGGGSQLRTKNAERAEPSRVHVANVFPAEGEGRDAGAPIGRCFEEAPAGDARGGAAARFQGLPPYSYPPENAAASRRSHPGGPVRPHAQAYR